jgi:hypothetical protein
MVPSTVATGALSGDKFVRIVTLTTPSLPLVDALLTRSQRWDSATLLNRQILVDEGPWKVSDVRRRVTVDGKAAAPGESLEFWRSFKGGSRRFEGRDGSNCYD